MPEGPEVRKYAMDLAKRVSGKTLREIRLLSGRYLSKPPGGLECLSDQLPIDIVGVGAHGKFLYWILKDEHSIWNTLGMSGRWSQDRGKHSRVQFVLNDGNIFFDDIRNFGTLKFVRGKFQLIEKLKSLGPDMLAEAVPDQKFVDCLRRKQGWEITKALMNQSVIAGVGNYIKADSLWLAKISPLRKVEDLSDAELAGLNRAIRQVMLESLSSGGATIKTYKNFDGSKGEYNQRFLVYNQKTDPDGNDVIKEQTADGRTTYWCPAVQY